jgi:hypothetical protein
MCLITRIRIGPAFIETVELCATDFFHETFGGCPALSTDRRELEFDDVLSVSSLLTSMNEIKSDPRVEQLFDLISIKKIFWSRDSQHSSLHLISWWSQESSISIPNGKDSLAKK